MFILARSYIRSVAIPGCRAAISAAGAPAGPLKGMVKWPVFARLQASGIQRLRFLVLGRLTRTVGCEHAAPQLAFGMMRLMTTALPGHPGA
jgi:hypothetical protein